LNDLVSYNYKHNDANLENNNDGTNDNNSWNCGAEGDTDDPGIIALRKQLIKNFAWALLSSAGTPMLLGGDEFMRSQKGNNNAYCQDNAISWFDWSNLEKHSDIFDFFRKAIAFTRQHTVLQNRKFLAGVDEDGNRIPDISWFGPDGGRAQWDDPEARVLCYMLDGAEEPSKMGDYQLYLIVNSDYRPHSVSLPHLEGKSWSGVVDTGLGAGEDFLDAGKKIMLNPPDAYVANPRSTVILVGRQNFAIDDLAGCGLKGFPCYKPAASARIFNAKYCNK
jgi:glycogen operon protein